MASRECVGVNKNSVNLSVAQKLKFIKTLVSGASVIHECDEYGIKKTVSNTCKARAKFPKYALNFSADGSSNKSGADSTRKHTKLDKEKELDEVVYYVIRTRTCMWGQGACDGDSCGCRKASQISQLSFQG